MEVQHCTAGVFYCENSNIFTQENDFTSVEVLNGQDVPEERAWKGLQEQLKLETMESEGENNTAFSTPHRSGAGSALLLVREVEVGKKDR